MIDRSIDRRRSVPRRGQTEWQRIGGKESPIGRERVASNGPLRVDELDLLAKVSTAIVAASSTGTRQCKKIRRRARHNEPSSCPKSSRKLSSFDHNSLADAAHRGAIFRFCSRSRTRFCAPRSTGNSDFIDRWLLAATASAHRAPPADRSDRQRFFLPVHFNPRLLATRPSSSTRKIWI